MFKLMIKENNDNFMLNNFASLDLQESVLENHFSYFSTKTYVVDTPKNTVQMRPITHV